MNPDELRFRETHEWMAISDQGDEKTATIGISAHAVESLTDVVYLELPEVGKVFQAGDSFGHVESVKAVSDLYAPLHLEVTEVNDQLPNNLSWLSDDPYGQAWMIKGRVLGDGDLNSLMDHSAYQKQIAESS